LSVLIYVGLSALENRYYTTVRFFIIMGAVGIMCVGKWIVDTVGAPSYRPRYDDMAGSVYDRPHGGMDDDDQ
jgi:hypothetical protein